MSPIDADCAMKLSAISMRTQKALQPCIGGGTRPPNSVFRSTYGMDEPRRQGGAFSPIKIGEIHLFRTGFPEPLARAAAAAYTRVGRKMHADPPMRVGSLSVRSFGDETLQGEPKGDARCRASYSFLIEFSEYESATTERGILRSATLDNTI
jgi:hypothetical protein